MADKTQKSTFCLALFYDILGSIISIIDVATDTICCIQYFRDDRMIFFGISLGILILAQCGYSIACATRFDTIDHWRPWKSCLMFCFCLPFGTLFAFFAYFGSEDGWEWLNEFIRYDLDLDGSRWYIKRDDDSKLMQWIRTKLDKQYVL